MNTPNEWAERSKTSIFEIVFVLELIIWQYSEMNKMFSSVQLSCIARRMIRALCIRVLILLLLLHMGF